MKSDENFEFLLTCRCGHGWVH